MGILSAGGDRNVESVLFEASDPELQDDNVMARHEKKEINSFMFIFFKNIILEHMIVIL